MINDTKRQYSVEFTKRQYSVEFNCTLFSLCGRNAGVSAKRRNGAMYCNLIWILFSIIYTFHKSAQNKHIPPLPGDEPNLNLFFVEGR